MRFGSKPLPATTFTASSSSWLWHFGAPIWKLSALGAAVALTSLAAPILPTVLPDADPDAPATQTMPTSTPTGNDDDAGSAEVAVPSSTADKSHKAHRSSTATPSTAVTSTATRTATRTATTAAPATTADADSTAFTSTSPWSLTIAADDDQNELYLVTAVPCDGCVSGSRVIGVGLFGTLTVHVDAPSAGSRTLTIAYECLFDRTLVVTVNDGDGQSISTAATGGLSEPGWTSLTVDLQEGENSIEFSNPLGLGPNLDQFTVS